MELTTVIGIGIGVAMDAFAVAVTNGMAVSRLRINFAFKQSFMFAIFQAAMPVIGWLTGIALSKRVEMLGQWLAFLILFTIGLKMCIDCGIKKEKHSNECLLFIKEPPFRVLMALAIATSIDALAIGITFACSNVSKFSILLFYVLIIGFITFVFCFVGSFIGRKSGDILKGKSEIIGGAVLIIMAIKMLLNGLKMHH
ncbi:MAG TPA: manganese efflux pump MntP family protein [Clostridia bacterium]|nr:manganese efflux pump MntP family protein [Clostridia bacterium]